MPETEGFFVNLIQSWQDKSVKSVDFYLCKGILDDLFTALHTKDVRWERYIDPILHPGRAAAAFSGETMLGYLGELHPVYTADIDLPGRAYVFKFDFQLLMDNSNIITEFKHLTRFPAVTRDLAVVADASMESETILQAIYKAGGDSVVDVRLFDLYTGVHVSEGKKSLAYSIKMRAEDRTLTDMESLEILTHIKDYLTKNYGATFRT